MPPHPEAIYSSDFINGRYLVDQNIIHLEVVTDKRGLSRKWDVADFVPLLNFCRQFNQNPSVACIFIANGLTWDSTKNLRTLISMMKNEPKIPTAVVLENRVVEKLISLVFQLGFLKGISWTIVQSLEDAINFIDQHRSAKPVDPQA